MRKNRIFESYGEGHDLTNDKLFQSFVSSVSNDTTRQETLSFLRKNGYDFKTSYGEVYVYSESGKDYVFLFDDNTGLINNLYNGDLGKDIRFNGRRGQDWMAESKRNINGGKIRLTESQFNKLVGKCVKKALNEIGETPNGQYKLGALHARKSMRKDWNGADDVYEFAKKKRRQNGEAKDSSNYGFEDDDLNPMYNSFAQGFCDHRDKGYRKGGKW